MDGMQLPQWLARFNRHVTNPIQRMWAGWAPTMGILTHVGRRSGGLTALGTCGIRTVRIRSDGESRGLNSSIRVSRVGRSRHHVSPVGASPPLPRPCHRPGPSATDSPLRCR